MSSQFPGGCSITNYVLAQDSCSFTNLAGDVEFVTSAADPASIAVSSPATYTVTSTCTTTVGPRPVINGSGPMISGETGGCVYTVTVKGNGTVTVFDPNLVGDGECNDLVIEGGSDNCSNGYVALAPSARVFAVVIQPSLANLKVTVTVTDKGTNQQVCTQTGQGIFAVASVTCGPYNQTLGHFYAVTVSWNPTQITCAVPSVCPIDNGTVAFIQEVDTPNP